MTTYASKDELKAYLWIPLADTSKDSLLTIYLESAESYINWLFNVDTLVTGDYTERLKINANSQNLWFEFVARKRPVTAIKQINWIDFVWTEWIDYIVEYQRVITFKNIAQYLAWFWWDTLLIKYTAGYTTIPADIKLAEMMIAGESFANAGWNGAYDSYAIWDEKVVFKKESDQKAFMRLLAPYKIFV